MISFGQTIRQLRTSRNLTQRALAKQVGINFTYLSKIENNRLEPGQSPKKETITRLADALGTDSDDLLLLARRIPDSISRQIIQRPALFRRIACLDDETFEQLLDSLEAGQHEAAVDALGKSPEFFPKVLDSLSQHIAILDERGRIIAVNQAWRLLALNHQGDNEALGTGADYLDVCPTATNCGSQDAEAIAAALGEILSGQRSTFEIGCSCHSPTQRRWCLLRVTSFQDGNAIRAVVSHDFVTDQQLSGLEKNSTAVSQN